MQQIQSSYRSLLAIRDKNQAAKQQSKIDTTQKGRKTYFRDDGKELVSFVKEEDLNTAETPTTSNELNRLCNKPLDESESSSSGFVDDANDTCVSRAMIRNVCQKTNEGFNEKVNKNFQSNKLQDDNIGFKMLQNLGWQGGSLGKRLDGIEEPVR